MTEPSPPYTTDRDSGDALRAALPPGAASGARYYEVMLYEEGTGAISEFSFVADGATKVYEGRAFLDVGEMVAVQAVLCDPLMRRYVIVGVNHG